MKNFILASSLAALAASEKTIPAVKSLPITQKAKTFRELVTAERKSNRAAAKADTKVAKMAVETAQKVAKDEGVVFTESHMPYFFEIVQGVADCSTTVARVEGWEAGRCMDYVIDDNGMGITESEMVVKPNNYGFPIVLFFEGHGCREENLVDHYRLRKTEFGFPREYTTGGCMPVYGDSTATVPMFHQGAMWQYMRYEPFLPSVMQGIDGKDKGCRRNKYAGYDIITAWMCNPDHKDDGTVEYRLFDITNCDSDYVEEKFFSAPDCAATSFLRSEVHQKEECVFDYNEFKMYLQDEGDAAFEYRSRGCSWGSGI
mmetsp:Transcript_19594/g.32980  ORF Transcript_19594/g.32980 Transcript_19594/m.32980 type:complete len:315 (-) Transcript_19594:245-1189(-)